MLDDPGSEELPVDPDAEPAEDGTAPEGDDDPKNDAVPEDE